MSVYDKSLFPRNRSRSRKIFENEEKEDSSHRHESSEVSEYKSHLKQEEKNKIPSEN